MIINFKIGNTIIYLNFANITNHYFEIKSVPYSYRVDFVDDAMFRIKMNEIQVHNQSKHFIFIDEKVANIYQDSYLTGNDLMKLVATEDNKVLSVATTVLDKLQEKNITKNELFLSIGGGITQDISAFVKSIYKRGIPWVYVPTTLLSMADSCIGAKSCLNYGGIKNQLGLFSAPKQVYIYEGFLKSLHYRDILSGYGEIVKLAIVGGKGAIEKFVSLTQNQGDNKLININQLIKLALLVKQAVIEIDEFEADIRKALNYGHTIGHAIEPLVNYNIPHGIAVSIGIIIENLLALHYGTLPEQEAKYLNEIVIKFIDQESLNQLKSINITALINNMKRDKKAVSDDIYLAVPSKIGFFDILMIKIDSTFEVFLSESFDRLANV